MTDAEAALPQDAAKPRPTVQHLAQAVADLSERVDVLGQVGVAHDGKLVKLQEQQQATGVLLNGLTKDQRGEAVKPSKLDNLSARLEALESSARGEITDYAPVIQELTERLNRMADANEKCPGTTGGVHELQAQVDQMEARLARAEHDQPSGDLVAAPVHEALADRIDDAHDRIQSLALAIGATAFKEPQPVTPVQPGRGVAAKILALMDEVTAIGKNRDARGGGVNFKFRGVEDAQNAVGQAQRKVRILILPDVVSWDYSQEQVTSWDKNNNREKTVTWSTSRLTMRYTFVDPDDGSQTSVTMVGEGKDNSDKSASKAASMACKYALFQALMIPFEDVDESDKHNDARAEYDRPRTTGAREEPGYRERQAEHGRDPQPPAEEMTPLEKAASLIQWVRKAQAEPAEKALKAVQTALERTAANNLGDLEIEGIPVRTHLATMLQNAGAAIANKAASAGAQGMTRQEQQGGQGVRAAATSLPPVTEEEYDQANRVLADPNADEREMQDALVVARRFESQITGGE